MRKKKKGFTLIELLVVIAIIAMLLAILMPALSKVKKIAMRVVCGTNLKGLGTAQTVYANDYADQYAVAGFGLVNQAPAANISNQTPGYNNPAKARTTWANGASVGASLYLLVREADVSPKSFVCPAGSETAYDGRLPAGQSLDITELWDFGNHLGVGIENTGPIHCVSFAYHHPYSRFAADATKSAAFATMADKNPWLDAKIPTQGGMTADDYVDRVAILTNDWSTPGASVEKYLIQVANAQPHDRDGQNVLYGDGHNNYEKRSDVGIKHDNIYNPQGGSPDPIRQGSQVARAQGTFNAQIPTNSNDSFLVNDSRVGDP